MSSNLAALAAPNGDNGNHQGHCSRCGKVWTLNERQGVCPWCGKPASCNSTTSKPRHIKSRSHGRKRQGEPNGNGYGQLNGEWLTYYKANNGLTCGNCSQTQRRKCKEHWLYGECPKAIKLESLNKPIIDGEGNLTELGELIADDKALDLDAWVSDSTWEIGYPKRLVNIAYKLKAGIPLDNGDRSYLKGARKNEQTNLFA